MDFKCDVCQKIFDRKCYNCLKTTWMDKTIPLELHHIDGNSSNNCLEN